MCITLAGTGPSSEVGLMVIVLRGSARSVVSAYVYEGSLLLVSSLMRFITRVMVSLLNEHGTLHS